MKAIGVREFRDKVTKILRTQKPVIITKYDKPEGLYIPLSSIKHMPVELKREIFMAFSSNLAMKLAQAGINEDEILEEFDYIRGHRG